MSPFTAVELYHYHFYLFSFFNAKLYFLCVYRQGISGVFFHAPVNCGINLLRFSICAITLGSLKMSCSPISHSSHISIGEDYPIAIAIISLCNVENW